MTQTHSKSMQSILQEALSKDGDFLKEIVRMLLQELMEEERNQQVGVLSHKRDHIKRKVNRNGYKPRSFHTRVGSLLLAKPQIREFAFQTQLFENYQRSEKAVNFNRKVHHISLQKYTTNCKKINQFNSSFSSSCLASHSLVSFSR